jgi:hypothetical protein
MFPDILLSPSGMAVVGYWNKAEKNHPAKSAVEFADSAAYNKSTM